MAGILTSRFWPAVRVLSVGDSLSIQGGANSWQLQLLTRLRRNSDAKVAWHFVGSQNGPAPIWCDGYAGFRIDQLTPATYYTNNPADVVVVMAGVNDAIADASAATMKTRMVAFLDSLFTVAQTAHVVLCRIPPMSTSYGSYTSARAAVIVDFNTNKLQEVVDAYANRWIELVDCHTGFLTDGSYHQDGVHQNHLGAKFIAERLLDPSFYGRGIRKVKGRDLESA